MAAPTNAAYVKKALANSEPSTHGPKLTSPERGALLASDPNVTRSATTHRSGEQPLGCKVGAVT